MSRLLSCILACWLQSFKFRGGPKIVHKISTEAGLYNGGKHSHGVRLRWMVSDRVREVERCLIFILRQVVEYFQ